MEKYTSGEKVLSGLELEQFRDKVKTAMENLKSLSTLTDLKKNLNTSLEEYQKKFASDPVGFLNPEAQPRKVYSGMEDLLKKISKVDDNSVTTNMLNLLEIYAKVDFRQKRNSVMKDSIPWGELDKMFKHVVDDTLGRMGDISPRVRVNAKNEALAEYKSFIDDKKNRLRNDSTIIIIYDLIKNQDLMNKK